MAWHGSYQTEHAPYTTTLQINQEEDGMQKKKNSILTLEHHLIFEYKVNEIQK
jgi:hypothetical protein